jgi:hypothetical protein
MEKEKVKNIMKFIGSKNERYRYEVGNDIFENLLNNSDDPEIIFHDFNELYELNDKILLRILSTRGGDNKFGLRKFKMYEDQIDFKLSTNALRIIVGLYDVQYPTDGDIDKQYNFFKNYIESDKVVSDLTIIKVLDVMYRKNKLRSLELIVSNMSEIFDHFQVDNLVMLKNTFVFVKEVKNIQVYEVLLKSPEFVERVSDSDGILYTMFKFSESIEWLYNKLTQLGFKDIFKSYEEDSFYNTYLSKRSDEINKIINKERNG